MVECDSSSQASWVGSKVIYGDTDSLFVKLPSWVDKATAFKMGQDIADVVTASNPAPIKLKLEKVCDWVADKAFDPDWLIIIRCYSFNRLIIHVFWTLRSDMSVTVTNLLIKMSQNLMQKELKQFGVTMHRLLER